MYASNTEIHHKNEDDCVSLLLKLPLATGQRPTRLPLLTDRRCPVNTAGKLPPDFQTIGKDLTDKWITDS
ncbi:hypothetical protein JOB18_044977 [Solea senegalensis]|uniref:Uncharacterized protein n=1 Tax=Solea senegalensis TaxID=28829 RepID=A0AAV6Q8A7_SOLSE|nr:hypothetical protein JOB18_044977 [Solea senegalensis]